VRPTENAGMMTLPLRSNVSRTSWPTILVASGFGECIARAVGAFDLEEIHVFDRLRIAQDVVIAAANVAAEKIAEFFPVLADVENNLR
jgi:hypothetical protein